MPSPTTLPARVDSTILARYLTAGEPVVLVKLVAVGNTAPYDFRDAKGSRAYVFRWDLKAGGHVLRVPLSLWQANKAQMAHDIMDQRRLANAIVVTVEMPVPPVTTFKQRVLAEYAELGERLTKLDAFLSDIPPNVELSEEDHTLLVEQQSAMHAYHDVLGRRVARLDDEPAKAPENTSPPEKGATDTANEGDVQNVVGLSQASPPTVAPASEETSEPQDGIPIIYGDKPLYEAAFGLVEQPKRIKALAALLDVEEEALRASIKMPGSKVELAQAGWVRRKES